MSGINGRTLYDYQLMLADSVRMQAYEQAIGKTCPGKVVCEIGTGLGPLSLMALKAGAARVYGIESNVSALQIAVEVIKAHGFDESRFIPIQGVSSQVSLPERVDVILSETLDSMGLGENTAFYMRDAYHRFLKPDGCFVPRQLDCWVALASPADFLEKEHFWKKSLVRQYGMDFSRVIPSLRSCKQTLSITAEEVHSEWCCWQQIEFSKPITYRCFANALMKANRPGLSLGLACAFNALLAPGVRISTFPDDGLTHWKQGFMPFPNPITLANNDVVYVELDLAEIDHPSLHFELRVMSGSVAQVTATLQQRKAA